MGKTDKDVPWFVHEARDPAASFFEHGGVWHGEHYRRKLYHHRQRRQAKDALQAQQLDRLPDGRSRSSVQYDAY